MRLRATLVFSVIGLAFLGLSSRATADAIPYPNVGHENTVVYTFHAMNTGHVDAYFAGSTASYENNLGMEINGVLSPNGFGLDNHTSALGQVFNLGNVQAGDILTFVLHNIVPGLGNLYSDPTLNAPYDHTATGHNHVYSTPYTVTNPIIDSIPAGTYVAFEDLPASNPPDWNYHDETFVFTNVGVSVPLPSSGMGTFGLLLGLGGFGWVRRFKTA